MAVPPLLFWLLHNHHGGSDKFYIVAVVKDPTDGFDLTTWWGRASATDAQDSKLVAHSNNAGTLAAEALKIVAKKKGGGYEDMLKGGYVGGRTISEGLHWLRKVKDRIVGLTDSPTHGTVNTMKKTTPGFLHKPPTTKLPNNPIKVTPSKPIASGPTKARRMLGV